MPGAGVSPSGYYQWRAAKPRPIPDWQFAAQHAFLRHTSRYGTRRLRAGLSCGSRATAWPAMQLAAGQLHSGP
ncbi:hypothetical protein [Hymenobacter psoromatis]|uniref:hypothetical protein n=1 Tax=Hymenobacter psoromatis TaxID=1484116 RepID=UPI001CBD2DDB|nr:hypothetical protein [Hymenobacter psoromatis]